MTQSAFRAQLLTFNGDPAQSSNAAVFDEDGLLIVEEKASGLVVGWRRPDFRAAISQGARVSLAHEIAQGAQHLILTAEITELVSVTG